MSIDIKKTGKLIPEPHICMECIAIRNTQSNFLATLPWYLEYMPTTYTRLPTTRATAAYT